MLCVPNIRGHMSLAQPIDNKVPFTLLLCHHFRHCISFPAHHLYHLCYETRPGWLNVYSWPPKCEMTWYSTDVWLSCHSDLGITSYNDNQRKVFFSYIFKKKSICFRRREITIRRLSIHINPFLFEYIVRNDRWVVSRDVFG